MSYYEHGVYKVTLNTAKNGATFTKRGRCCRGTSSGSNTYFYYPYGLSVDTTNNRVLVANYSGSSVHALDLDLTYIKTFGGSSGTRMTGAHEAIKAIVTDSFSLPGM